MSNPIFSKSVEFLAQIALFHESYVKSGLDTTVSQQLLNAATELGANINKSVYGEGKDEFNDSIQNALKNSVECVYLLNTLIQMNLFQYDYMFLLSMAQDIRNVLMASVNAQKKTSKGDDKWAKYRGGGYSGNYGGK